MPSHVLKRFKIPVVLFLAALLVLNFPLIQGIDQDEEKADGDDGLGESRILTDEEVEAFGLEPPTRSEPWNKWDRIGYHRGGEEGAAVYHAEHNGVYVYGGGYPTRNGHTSYDDLFFFDLSTEKWEAIERQTSPGGRYRFSEAYDPAEDKLYIYGGYAGGSEANDLWEFNFTSMDWTRINSGVFPEILPDNSDARRIWAPMVADPVGQKLYIHMGQGDDTNNEDNLSGFWTLDLTNPAGAPVRIRDGTQDGMVERYTHDMCIDPDNRKIYLYGGYNDIQGYLNEMWVYDIISNTWAPIPLHPDLSVIYGARMFYRPADGTVNLWGGRLGGSSYENTRLWSYDTGLSSWENTTFADPPNGRLMYHNHYSPDADRFVAFAGRYYGQPSRYRDLNYLDLGTMNWTQFDNEYLPSSTTNGIFAYNDALRRIYYIGPNDGYYNGTEYLDYFDLATDKWYGPFYNQGENLPNGRSNAGICYDEANNTVYLYGGGYTTGPWDNRQYHDLADFYKLDLDTYNWEEVFPAAFPGERQGFNMEFNPVDGKVYFYGGYNHPTTASDIEIVNDFWKYDPQLEIFSQITLTGTNPGGRRGAALCIVEESNTLYLFGGEENTSPNPTERRDLWKYDIGSGVWTKLAQVSSSRISAELDYDPLTKELLLTGGGTDDIYRYRILEDAWYLWYPQPNPGTLSNGHASVFIPEDRDLWVYGGGAKSGIWKIGIPPRLAIQTATFENAENDEDLAYAMYKSYTFKSRIKVVNAEDDLDKITFELPHKSGNFRLIYNRTEDAAGREAWTELDNNDYATLTSPPTVSWNGLFATFSFDLMFHWNWSHKTNAIDRLLKVKAYGNVVDGDELVVRDFLRVRNYLEFIGDLSLHGAVQGELESGDWVQFGELITVSGLKIVYQGTTDVFPPSGSYDLELYFNKDLNSTITLAPGETINFTVPAAEAEYIKDKSVYDLNISGINEEIGEGPKVSWKLNFDGDAPGAPPGLMFHADDFDDQRILYDDDLDVYVTWSPSNEEDSGVKTYYWSYDNNEGTRIGDPLNVTEIQLTLPQTGINTIYVWAEDYVGNIGLAAEASILIDDQGIDFTIISPNLNETIPYTSVEIEINMTDIGGSKIIPETVQYRYTFNGQADEMWIGSDPWEYLPDLWGQGPQDTLQFSVNIGVDTIKLSDSDENFIQIRARDGAGAMYLSSVYNIKVDTSLRFPEVTLLSPEDGATFDDAEDVLLQWEVDFFEPSDVIYYLYISDVKEKVELQQEEPEMVSGTEFSPSWLYFGEYYWTIIPEARGVVGTCLSGIWTLEITNDANFAFTAETADDVHKYQQGQGGIPIYFTIVNTGQEGSWINPTTDLSGIAEIEEWVNLGEEGYSLQVGSSREISCLLKIKDNAPTGVYDLVFYFVSDRKINRSVEISVEIIPKVIEGDDDDSKDSEGQLGMIMAFVIVGIIALVMIIGALYFTVFKKKKGRTFDDSHLDELEKELETPLSDRDEFAVAPVPQGLGTTEKEKISAAPDSDKLPPAKADEQQEAPEEEADPVKLAEEGSEDDWMNLVAQETKAIEDQSEVEEDKTVHTEAQSLQDILAEMSGGVDE